jgi:hypothetical protein
MERQENRGIYIPGNLWSPRSQISAEARHRQQRSSEDESENGCKVDAWIAPPESLHSKALQGTALPCSVLFGRCRVSGDSACSAPVE